MPIRVECPGCGTILQLKETSAGKRIRCKECGDPVTVPQKMKTRRGKTQKPKHGTNLVPILAAVGGLMVVGVAVVVVIIAIGNNSKHDDATAAHSAPETPKTQINEQSKTKVELPADTKVDTPPETTQTRRYPSYANALVEPPDWLIDSEAPFDVAEYLRTPSWEENAAPLYLDAMFEFTDEVKNCFPKEEAERRAAVWQKRNRLFKPVWDAMIGRRRVDLVEFHAIIREFDTGFEKLAEAQKRPQCAFEIPFDFTATPGHLEAVKQISYVAQMRVQRSLNDGDVESAIQDFESVLQLTQDVRARIGLTGAFAAISVEMLATEFVLSRLLEYHKLTVEKCDRILAALARHDSKSSGRLADGLKGEYIFLRVFLHDLEHRAGTMNPEHLRNALKIRSDSMGELILRLGTNIFARSKQFPQFARHVALIDSHLARMNAESFQREVDALNEVLKESLEAESSTLKKLMEQSEAQRKRLAKTQLLIYMLANFKSYYGPVFQADFHVDAARCLVAIRRWQAKHGSRPPSLHEAVQEAGMTEIPMGGYSIDALTMIDLNGDIAVYSFGPDGVDDKARSNWNINTQRGDLVLKFTPP